MTISYVDKTILLFHVFIYFRTNYKAGYFLWGVDPNCLRCNLKVAWTTMRERGDIPKKTILTLSFPCPKSYSPSYCHTFKLWGSAHPPFPALLLATFPYSLKLLYLFQKNFTLLNFLYKNVHNYYMEKLETI